MANEIYLRAEDISKSFGDLRLFSNISLSVHKGDKIAIIAKNGAGKSTFLQILSDKIDYDSGSITTRNGIHIAYLEQSPKFESHLSIEEAISSLFQEQFDLLKEYQNLLNNDPEERLNKVMNQIEALDAWGLEVRINEYLSRLNLHDKTQKMGELSGGQVKRVALASVLLQQPDLLILDEPTNHLDIDMIEWLEDYLISSNMSLLMVTHDRFFLDRVCNKIVELDNNEFYTYNGNYEYYLTKRSQRIEQKNAEVEKARQLYKKELEWLNRMPKARTGKAKYRVDNVEKIKSKAQQKITTPQISLDFSTRRLGTKVIDIYNISKRFDDLELINDFSYKFRKGEKVAIIGNNGTGKSTLMNIIAGIIKPDQGYLEVGSTVSIGYYHQDGLKHLPNKRVIDIVTDIMEVVDFGEQKRLSARAFLNYFLFPPKMQQVKVEKLSGGEKRRLYLMTVLMRNPNFLILDEPTNDLDIVTLNILEDYLMQFSGTLLIVSHDRYFTNKLVEHVFAFEKGATIKDFPGNYSDYRAYKQQEEQQLKQLKKEETSANNEKKYNKDNKNDYSKRMSYKEKQEFKSLEEEINLLNERISELTEQLNSATLEHEQLYSLSQEYQEKKDELDEKEMRWLELSEKA